MAAKVKGFILKSRLAFITERFGSAALERVLARLSEADRKQLTGMVLAVSWYPSDLNARLDDAIIQECGGDARKAFRDLGRKSAEDNLGKFQSGFVKGKNPVSFMAQTAQIYKMYYEAGEREWKPASPTSGAMITRGAEHVTQGDCLTVMGWYERALEMVGAKKVEIHHPVCRATGGTECRYELRWS